MPPAAETPPTSASAQDSTTTTTKTTTRGPSPQTIARWSSVTVPLMVVAVVSWAAYVVIAKLALSELSPGRERGASIAVIVLLCLLLFATVVAYVRIIVTIYFEPGLVPLGNESADEKGRRSKGRRKKTPGGNGHVGHAGVFVDEDGTTWAERQHAEKMKRLETYVPREVFVCDFEGLPLWCDKCSNWKPDRTHHCSDLGRCVRRMDHFCPWVGGIVSETTMKFFLQFTFYATFLGLFILITDAILVARDRNLGRHLDTHMAVLLGFCSLFTLFAVGIFGNTFVMTLRNHTTVEALNRGNATYHLSVLLTPAWCQRSPNDQYPFRTTTYPGAPGATYAILLTRPGDNPWDMGPFKNLQSVMGESIIDWFLPFKLSPCTKHDRQDGEFEMGPVVEWTKKDATGY